MGNATSFCPVAADCDDEDSNTISATNGSGAVSAMASSRTLSGHSSQCSFDDDDDDTLFDGDGTDRRERRDVPVRSIERILSAESTVRRSPTVNAGVPCPPGSTRTVRFDDGFSTYNSDGALEAEHLRTLLQGYRTRIKHLEQKEVLAGLQIRGYRCSIQDHQYRVKTLQSQVRAQQKIIDGYEERIRRHGNNVVLQSSRSAHSVGSLSSTPTASASPSSPAHAPSIPLSLSELQQWLFLEGTKSNQVQPWMVRYCQKLRDSAVPVDRLFITNLTPNDPTRYMYGWIWEHNRPFVQFQYTEQQLRRKLQSMPREECFQLLYTHRKTHVHRKRHTTPSDTAGNIADAFQEPGRFWLSERSSDRGRSTASLPNHQHRRSDTDAPFQHYLGLPVTQNDKFTGSVAWVTKSSFTKHHLRFFQQSMPGLSLVVRYQTNEANQETLRKRMEDTIHQRTQELATANAKYQRANKRIQQQSQSQLRHFAMMSHEIRTPLNCIIGLSSLLVNDRTLNAEQQEALNMINTSGDLLLRVVDDVLNFSKLAVGEVVFHMEPTSFRDTLYTVFHAIQQHQHASVQLRVVTPQPLPCRIVTDGRRLQQVLYNLLGNAFKFGRDGKYVDCTVSTTTVMVDGNMHSSSSSSTLSCSQLRNGNSALGIADEDGNDRPSVQQEMQMLRIEIQDYGVGIHRKHMANIFQPFQQGSVDTEREYGGTGLGLTITSNLIKAMGGTITVESEYGQWCRFTVQLPLLIPEDAKADSTPGGVNGTEYQSAIDDNSGVSPAGERRTSTRTTELLSSFGNVPTFQFSPDAFRQPTSNSAKSASSIQNQKPVTRSIDPTGTARAPLDDDVKSIGRPSVVTSVPPPDHEQLMNDLDRMMQGQQQYQHDVVADDVVTHSRERLSSRSSQNHEVLMNYLDRIEQQAQTQLQLGDTDSLVNATSSVSPDATSSGVNELTEQHKTSVKSGTSPVPISLLGSLHEPGINTGSVDAESRNATIDSLKEDRSIKLARTLERPLQMSSDIDCHELKNFKLDTDDPATSERLALSTATMTAMKLLKDLRVLVAEDNKVNQKVCRRMLTRIGLSDIDVVENGQKAVDQEIRREYDLVLMDLEMPVMNGLDATRLIVSRRNVRGAHLPRVLFLSAHALEEYKAKAREAGGDGFLSKPFRLEAIEQSLSEMRFDATSTVQTGAEVGTVQTAA